MIINREMLHRDWISTFSLLYQQPLLELLRDKLPNISYVPKTGMFDIFSMPMKDIKVVILKPEPIPLNPQTKEKFENLRANGVFILNTSLTVEVGGEHHFKYWESFIKRVVSHLSNNKNCIWLIWGESPKKFIPYIQRRFHVKDYDSETIEQIPIGDWNYIIQTAHPTFKEETYEGTDFANSILKNKSINVIKW